MKTKHPMRAAGMLALSAALLTTSCKPKGMIQKVESGTAEKVYVPPGQHDEFYNIVSGGFNGRHLRLWPAVRPPVPPDPRVFRRTPNPAGATARKPSRCSTPRTATVPWDDQHHIALSQTKGEHDGRWIFGNCNNTPRVARISFETFRTEEILEIPNSSGNHSSPFITENSEYLVAGTRFAYPLDDEGSNPDVPISSYKENFKSTLSMISIAPDTGRMKVAFQVLLPGIDIDLARAGKGKSHGWMFFSCYNSELAHTLLEVNASQKDKDFIGALDWKKCEEYIKAGKGRKSKAKHLHNVWDEKTHTRHLHRRGGNHRPRSHGTARASSI